MAFDYGSRSTPGTSAAATPAATPGKRTLTEGLAVQLQQVQRAETAPASTEQVHDAASRGIETPTTQLPHAAAIQASFGDAHDVSAIHAHVGGGAADACADMGASAFAAGSHVAFAGSPDLHTAAHEAAHVVQQAQGVNLYGGVGAAGDHYEQHADAVADRVVAGESAAELLGSSSRADRPTTVDSHAPVQRKEGKVTHQGKAGSGTVTARENDLDPGDNSNTNYSLEYAGKDADKAHWLQFVNFSMYAEVPGDANVYFTGSVQTTSGKKPFSTDKVTNWSVDSNSAGDPYYEAAGSNVRTPGKGTKIFDEPGGATIVPLAAQLVSTKAAKATKVTFIASFDTYLVQDGTSDYHVRWTATTIYDPVTKASQPIVYGTGGAGAVAALPKDLKAVLDGEYAGNKIT